MSGDGGDAINILSDELIGGGITTTTHFIQGSTEKSRERRLSKAESSEVGRFTSGQYVFRT